MSTFRNNESYKHKCAKETFKQWCQDRLLDNDDWQPLWPTNYKEDISWCTNRSQEAWLEYPIVVDEKVDSVKYNWDEIWRRYEDKASENEAFEDEGNENYVPSYSECIERNLHPIAVIDIVLPHKGRPLYFIEICHTNPVSEEKVKKLQKAGVTNLIEIDAEWILRQIDIPLKLSIKRWLIDNYGNMELRKRSGDVLLSSK